LACLTTGYGYANGDMWSVTVSGGTALVLFTAFNILGGILNVLSREVVEEVDVPPIANAPAQRGPGGHLGNA
jgi:hypothetical protein